MTLEYGVNGLEKIGDSDLARELERIRKTFQERHPGLEDIALPETTQKSADKYFRILDTTLTLPGLDFEITKGVLTNGRYLTSILYTVTDAIQFNIPGTRMAVTIYNNIIRTTGSHIELYDGEKARRLVFDRNMADILLMSDKELLALHGIGNRSLALLNEVLQPLRERFVEKQVEASE